MSPFTVTRLTTGLCVLFVAAAGVFAWWTNRARPEAASRPDIIVGRSGAALFAMHCGACHAADAIRDVIQRAPDREAKLRELETFLAQHGDASGEDDRTILAFLAAHERDRSTAPSSR
jgi:mono/diheme cytochrome c family protein